LQKSKNAHPSAFKQRDERWSRGSTLISVHIYISLLSYGFIVFNADIRCCLLLFVRQQSSKVVITWMYRGNSQRYAPSLFYTKTNNLVLIHTYHVMKL